MNIRNRRGSGRIGKGPGGQEWTSTGRNRQITPALRHIFQPQKIFGFGKDFWQTVYSNAGKCSGTLII